MLFCVQPTEIAQATSLVLHPHATNQYTILQSSQEPHLSKGQRVRLQQWILRVSSLGLCITAYAFAWVAQHTLILYLNFTPVFKSMYLTGCQLWSIQLIRAANCWRNEPSCGCW